MYLIRARGHSLGPPTRPAQSPDCFLLQLPVELILLVKKALAQHPSSVLILSQTCTALRDILHRPNGTMPYLEPRGQLCYRTAIARDLPDCWVCEACWAPHPVHPTDTPACMSGMTCPWKPIMWEQWAYGAGRLDDTNMLQLHHRHVQLALKLTRIYLARKHDGDEQPALTYQQQVYLSRLLQPQLMHDWVPLMDYATAGIRPQDAPLVLPAEYATQPRVVRSSTGRTGSTQLRFLLRESWLYRTTSPGQAPITAAALGRLRICPHTFVWSRNRHGSVVWGQLGRLRHLTPLAQAAAAGESSTGAGGAELLDVTDGMRWGRQPAASGDIHVLGGSVFNECVTTAFAVLGTGGHRRTARGSCRRCATDWAVRVNGAGDEAEVRAWHDFGPEASPVSAEWRTHVQNHRRPSGMQPAWLAPSLAACKRLNRAQRRELGSVRRMYDDGEIVGVPCPDSLGDAFARALGWFLWVLWLLFCQS